MLLLSFWLGASLGSFFHVVGYRLPLKQDWVRGRSACPDCSNRLRWFELLPIASFLLQKGKCRRCGAVIKPIYFWSEALSGTLFALTTLYFSGLQLVFAWLFLSLLLIITVTDLYYGLIPNKVLLFFLPLFMLFPYISWKGMLVGFSMLYGNLIIGKWLFKREALGGGDVKLYALIGLVLGSTQTVLSLIMGAVLALFFSSIRSKKTLPFGPFIAIASYICLIYGDSLWEIYRSLF
ncbi:MAG: prepilin peptidase [Turicibacter sp.]|nr:prepilin peptidase [Turicibacter sp.]